MKKKVFFASVETIDVNIITPVSTCHTNKRREALIETTFDEPSLPKPFCTKINPFRTAPFDRATPYLTTVIPFFVTLNKPDQL